MAGLAGSELAAYPRKQPARKRATNSFDLDSKAEDEFDEGSWRSSASSSRSRQDVHATRARLRTSRRARGADAAYRDGEEEALDFSDELAELLDDGGAEEDAEPVAERKAATKRHGRATALGRSHFRSC